MLTGTLAPISRHADWIETFELVDDDTAEPIDLSTASITVRLRRARQRPPHGNSSGYGTSYAYGGGSNDTVIVGSTDNGKVTISSPGIAELHFTPSDLQGLDSDTYEVSALLNDNGITLQLFLGTIPII